MNSSLETLIAFHCTENKLTEENTRIVCGGFIDLAMSQLCRVIVEDEDFNYFEGVGSSWLDKAACAVMWTLFVTLWPLRHWASMESLTNARFDLLIHR